MRLCECGCGHEANRRFVRGHQLRVSNPAKRPEIALKIKNWHTGRKQSTGQKAKISSALRGRSPWNKGLTKFTDLRVAAMAQKTSEALKGRVRPEEESLKAGASNKGKKRSDEFRRKMSLRTSGYMKVPENREKVSQRTRRLWADPNSTFNNPIYRKEWARKRGLRPTKPEMELLGIIESNQLPFRYVGDGEVVIGRKCPDFINVNGQKQIIELFGDYWHHGQNPQDRASVFAAYGFSTLVVWQHELREPEKVLAKLKEFRG